MNSEGNTSRHEIDSTDMKKLDTILKQMKEAIAKALPDNPNLYYVDAFPDIIKEHAKQSDFDFMLYSIGRLSGYVTCLYLNNKVDEMLFTSVDNLLLSLQACCFRMNRGR